MHHPKEALRPQESSMRSEGGSPSDLHSSPVSLTGGGPIRPSVSGPWFRGECESRHLQRHWGTWKKGQMGVLAEGRSWEVEVARQAGDSPLSWVSVWIFLLAM